MIAEFPEYPEKKIIYLIGEKSPYEFLSMLYPCGCGANIRLSLIKKDSPSWKISINKGLLSVNPSVWRNKGCRSHFLIRAGKIIWIKQQKSSSGNFYKSY